ncbi:60S acidic ribosomal protein P1 [Mycena rebaudengoi]|nr:60S acidic ribosomal protein P1 [Mycena rebaudengoi]
MASSDLAATYAALILADAGDEITSEKILTLTTAAGVELEPIWATLLSKALEGKNIKEMLSTVSLGTASAGPVATAAAVTASVTEPEVVEVNDGDGSDDSDEEGMFDLFG